MMTPANIAICWGPTILRPLKDDMFVEKKKSLLTFNDL